MVGLVIFWDNESSFGCIICGFYLCYFGGSGVDFWVSSGLIIL